MSILEIVLASVLAVVLGSIVVAWLFRKDTAIENRRRGAIKLASMLRGYGLKRIPAILEAYGVGDYSGIVHEVADTVRLFEAGPDAVTKEFEQVFDAVLSVKLQTEAGRAFIAAKLTDAIKPADASAIQGAPKPVAVAK